MDKLFAMVKVAGFKDLLKKIINKPKPEIKPLPTKKVISTTPQPVKDWSDLKELRKRLENGPDIEI